MQRLVSASMDANCPKPTQNHTTLMQITTKLVYVVTAKNINKIKAPNYS